MSNEFDGCMRFMSLRVLCYVCFFIFFFYICFTMGMTMIEWVAGWKQGIRSVLLRVCVRAGLYIYYITLISLCFI